MARADEKLHNKKIDAKEANSKLDTFTPRMKIEIVNRGEAKI
jgi:hypothetical protein